MASAPLKSPPFPTGPFFSTSPQTASAPGPIGSPIWPRGNMIAKPSSDWLKLDPKCQSRLEPTCFSVQSGQPVVSSSSCRKGPIARCNPALGPARTGHGITPFYCVIPSRTGRQSL
ncbi:unnamed protein product [Protopolystoma xenopodis]|uniref:Uncharacterized protein n=1 Tax=Protopolystoma xenopodis TaxID=117903 RepID=A0A3S5CIU7_9PLAT|nr:unnamed protein product [Protopolystoma xenopodis]